VSLHEKFYDANHFFCKKITFLCTNAQSGSFKKLFQHCLKIRKTNIPLTPLWLKILRSSVIICAEIITEQIAYIERNGILQL